MPWSIAQAKQRFSELLRQAAEVPQLIFNRERLVAAVIDAKEYRAFREWAERTAARNLAEELAELRELMRDEGCELELPPRSTRASGFLETLEEGRSPSALPGVPTRACWGGWRPSLRAAGSACSTRSGTSVVDWLDRPHNPPAEAR